MSTERFCPNAFESVQGSDLDRLIASTQRDLLALLEDHPEGLVIEDKTGKIRYEIKLREEDKGIEINRQVKNLAEMWVTSIGIETVKKAGENGIDSTELTIKTTAFIETSQTIVTYSPKHGGKLKKDSCALAFAPYKCTYNVLRDDLNASGIQDVGELPKHVDVYATAANFLQNFSAQNFAHTPFVEPQQNQ